MKGKHHYSIIATASLAVGVGGVSAAETEKKAVEPAAKPAPAKVYRFKAEPFFFKGSGSCEGIEFSDLNKDGIRDIVSGVPRGNIHVYYGAKGEKGISYGAKQVLKNAASGEAICVSHW